jgi:hypothetical protein
MLTLFYGKPVFNSPNAPFMTIFMEFTFDNNLTSVKPTEKNYV